MILDRDEGGFFERVVTVHPFASKTQVVRLNDVHVVHEFAYSHSRGRRKFRTIRWANSVIHLMRLIRRVQGLIRNERIDLVRSTDPYWAGLIGWSVTRIMRRPFCVSIHADYDKRYELAGPAGAPVIFGSRKIAKRLQGFVIRQADRVMPIRESLGEKAILDGASPETVRVIPHGIDSEVFRGDPSHDVRSLFGISEDKKILSFAGRLSRENYVGDVIELARNLNHRRDFIIVMAGDGPEAERLRALVTSEPNISRLIRLVGFQPHDIVIDLLRVSTACLCLMGGFSLIEACFAGRPVVSYDVEWHSELVKNNQTGCLVAEKDVDRLVQAVNYLLDHTEEASRMGKNARALAMERHAKEKTVAIKRKCYMELLGIQFDG